MQPTSPIDLRLPFVSRRAALVAGAASLVGCASTTSTSPASSQAKADLAGTTGELRAAINFGNPVLATRGPDGRPRGVSVDLAHEVARRLDLPLRLVTFTAAGQVTQAMQKREVDLGFVAIDPVRAADMEYTPPYVIIEGAYLVRANSPVQRNEDVDRAGTRVVVGRGSAYDLFLTRELKNARLVHAPTSAQVTDLFLSQNLEVAAGVRQQLEADAKRIGSSVRLLPGRFQVIEQAMAVPKGRVGAQQWLTGFIEEMKRTGFVADGLKRYGIEGAGVAPPAQRR